MVNFEAARAICEMKYVTSQQLTKPIAGRWSLTKRIKMICLHSCSPPTLFVFAQTRSQICCDSNPCLTRAHSSFQRSYLQCRFGEPDCRSEQKRCYVCNYNSAQGMRIAMIIDEANCIPGQTGNEASVDRLIKQITGFMTDISDEFKVIIVDAVRSLCLKFPSKHASMLTFLSGVLRDEGGYDFKRAVVEAMFDMIKFIKDCKEQALAHLCEFIEDCEFTKLSVRILHLLGMEGPKSPQPTKYIRFIYNRVVLENATVRAAAVTSLAKFGINSSDPGLQKSINVLLNR